MTRKPTPEEMTVRLHKAMDAAVGLSPDDISNVQSLIDVGEWLVAFETLCTQIYEWEIWLEPDVIRDRGSRNKRSAPAANSLTICGRTSPVRNRIGRLVAAVIAAVLTLIDARRAGKPAAFAA